MTAPRYTQVPYEHGITAYWAYRLASDGEIESVETIEAHPDDEARGKVRVMTSRYRIDLWERLRFLGSYPPRSADADV